MNGNSTKIMVASLACSLGALSANADDLANNLEQLSGGIEYATGDQYLAARFNTDDSAHTLTSVSVEILASAGTTASLKIYTDQGYEPGTLVATLNAPASIPTSLGTATFTSSGIELSASSSYWVVLSSDDSGSVGWAWSDSNEGVGLGFSTEWGISDADEPALWWTQDIYPLKVRIVVDEANACEADLNGDGALDFFDVSAFLAYFNNSDPIADFTGDGSFDFFDVSAFLTAFNAGCP